jgi:uncharacterized protein YukE
MSSFEGMDVGVVRRVSSGLQAQGQMLDHLISNIEATVGHAQQVWQGPDLAAFTHTWQSGLRSQLLAASSALHQMATSTSQNAEQQEGASGRQGTPGVAAQSKAGDFDPNMHAELSSSGLSVGKDELTLGSVAAGAYLLDKSGHWTASAGPVRTSAQAGVTEGVDGSANATIGRDGVNAQAGVFAGVRANASETSKVGLYSQTVAAKGSAGASAHADAHAGFDGVSANAGAFAGAEASLSSHQDLGGLGTTGHASARAGVGADAGGSATFKDGKIHVGGHAGASVGVGGSLGVDVDIDTHELSHTGDQAAQGLRRVFARAR